MTSSTVAQSDIDWNALLAPYREPDVWRSLYQIINTAVPFVLVWLAMLWSLQVGYWLTLLLAVPAALLVVRMFMFQHDCGHAALFRSRRANEAVGFAIGILTLVPYAYWRKTHAIHHATSGNLDQRGFGDITTLTVREYLGLSKWKRTLYRLYRHPAVMLLVGPTYQFILKHRLPLDTPFSWRREWRSVHWTNAALAAVIGIMWLAVGLDRFLLVQLPITLLAGSIGVFLFYVQHQFEDTYWRYREAWDYHASGLEGASHFVLPRVLRWFTANIGLHHIHHVAPRIPNYHLQRCFDENPELQQATRLTLGKSIKTLWLSLWDEDDRRLVRFRDLRRITRRLTDSLKEGEKVVATKPEAVPQSWR
jgi:omega-6 fatty acid desaturase (delta-12 desaturase)